MEHPSPPIHLNVHIEFYPGLACHITSLTMWALVCVQFVCNVVVVVVFVVVVVVVFVVVIYFKRIV